MGPWSRHLRESGAFLVGSYPSVCPSVNQLVSNLRCMRNTMGHRLMDLAKSCTASAADSCFHLAELSLWNNFLWVFNIELREGWLALACLRGRVVPLSSNMQCSRSFILVHWPLMEHYSIESVELRESRRRPKMFRDGLQLSGNLRHVTLCYHLLEYPLRDLMNALLSKVTTLDTLEIVSVRFSSVGVSMLGDLRDSCDAMRTLVFLENWIDVPEAQALTRCCVLADLVSCRAVIEEPIVRRCVTGTYGTLHGLEELFVVISGPRAKLEVVQKYNI
ncbi:hypothetical protein HPB49_003201 [Dermacentor silvarum]|uniref:Uncharacterized protein n=1 Tax=Dermacentor silvarum TaxID=543639 RepID=A0ACB8DTP3_DERSI|nr:hypothetical protein HPB49_003201 [Dermacentor silvarum]